MILAIIQARMGSSRLEGKVLMDLAGRAVIEHVYNRVKRSKYIDEVIVATSIEENNLPLISLCSKKQIRIFCGSENNVLDRFYQIAKLIQPDQVVRITADCPLHDSGVIDQVIEAHFKNSADYTTNCLLCTYPDGLDVEVFNYDVLEEAWNSANLPSELEHVTPYIKNSGKFKLHNVTNDVDYSSKRWTLDEKQDYVFIKEVYKSFHPRLDFSFEEIINFVENNKELEQINNHINRNEGLIASLEKDKR
jgi:spore coat polysaccharide biosynthesis protein SpsF (cytidylyltransferase family)